MAVHNRCSASEYKSGDPDCERLQDKNGIGHLQLRQVGGMKPQEVVCDGAAQSRGMVLLEDDTDSKEAFPQFFLAIQNGDTFLVDELLEKDATSIIGLKHGCQSALHAACHAKNLHALIRLLQYDAKVEVVDQLGRTPLHVAVDETWHDGVKELLEQGASTNTLSDPPKTVREVKVETPFHAAVRRGDLVSVTLMLQYQPDFSLRDCDECSILHLAAYARSIEITRLLMQKKACRKLVKTSDKSGNSVLHRALLKPCDSAEEGNVLTLVKDLIRAGANVNATNPQKETPLFMAAQQRLPKVAEELLTLGADPTMLTSEGQSVLHAACLNGCGSCLTLLLRSDLVKEMVTTPDNKGYEPFHYAVQSSSIDCCELLLTNGDHLTRANKNGLSRCLVILRHLPSATELLKRLFDANVRLSNLPQHDPDYRVTFDYSCLHQDADGIQSSVISELTNSNLEALLKHPLLESFLLFKWRKIKPFFYCSVTLYFLFLLIHTSFIIMTFGQNSWRWSEHTSTFTLFLILHITMFLFILIPDLIIMFANFKKYARQWETTSKAVALISSAFVIFSYIVPLSEAIQVAQLDDPANMTRNDTDPGRNYVHMQFVRRAAAISAFFSWVEFMMLLGRFPSLGSYVLMFTRVARAIIKFLAAFSSLIIGFAVSFMVLFPHKYYFSTFPLSLVKTLMMMIGEIDFADIIEDQELPILGCLYLVFFLFLVCVLLANLLIGLAVNDIPDLQRQGKIKRLSKQASYLVSYERLMRMSQSIRCFPRQLRILMTSRCRIPLVVTVLPNKDHSGLVGDFYQLPSETLHEAKLLGTEDLKEDFPTLEEDDDIVAQFKSFKVKYSRDRRQMNRRLAQLPDTATTEAMLKQRLDHIEQLLQQQLMQLSLQLSRLTSFTMQQTTQQLSYPTQQRRVSLGNPDRPTHRQQSLPAQFQIGANLIKDSIPQQMIAPQQTQMHPPLQQTYSPQLGDMINPQTQSLYPSHTQPHSLPSQAPSLHHSYTYPQSLQAQTQLYESSNHTPSLSQPNSSQAPQTQPPTYASSRSQDLLDGCNLQLQSLRPQQHTQGYQQLDQNLRNILSHNSSTQDNEPI